MRLKTENFIIMWAHFAWTSMIDFSTNKYIHNIQIKHLHDTFIYEKQLNKTVFIKKFADSQIELKN